MVVDDQTPHPLPEDPVLAEVAAALRDNGDWGYVLDKDWRVLYVTDEWRHAQAGGLDGLAPIAIGNFGFSSEEMRHQLGLRFGVHTVEQWRHNFLNQGRFILSDTPGARDELRERIDPSLRDLVDELEPVDVAAMSSVQTGLLLSGSGQTRVLAIRIRDATGRLAGTALILRPAIGMTTIGAMISAGDPRHLERMQRVAKAARRPAAILFADLDSSTPLAKRLPTANYFAFCRRLVRAADECVIEAGGLIGRHAGDGVVGFFLAETAGSESGAARACISAARSLQLAIREVCERSDLQPGDAVLRFGLHWGSTLYVGYITTPGRTEVAALGDEVNETARVETCASGGRTLATKALIERLDPHDARDLAIDPQQLSYTQLTDIPNATEKARRDAPAVAVCDLTDPNS